MSADLYTTIIIKGTDKELLSMLEVLRSFAVDNVTRYENNHDCAFFDCATVSNGDVMIYLDEDATIAEIEEFLSESGDELKIELSGPYGVFEEISEIGVFEKMAEAAPNAYFIGTVDGWVTGGDVSQKAMLKDGVLALSSTMCDDDSNDGVPMFVENLTYNPIAKEYRKMDDKILWDNSTFDDDEFDDTDDDDEFDEDE